MGEEPEYEATVISGSHCVTYKLAEGDKTMEEDTQDTKTTEATSDSAS